MKKKISRIFFIFISVIAFTIVGQGNTSQVEIFIDAGFDGKCKGGSVNPVKIDLHAKEMDFEGNLKIHVGEQIFIHPVHLSNNTKKEFLFSIPILKENDGIEVSLETNEGVIQRKEKSLEVCNEKTIFIGILSEEPQNYYYLKNIKNDLLKGNDIEIIKLDEGFKYSLSDLNNLNFIFIDNFNVENLSDESGHILNRWAEKGNTLFIGADKYEYKTLTGIFSNLKSPEKTGDGFIIPIKNNLEENIIQKYTTSYQVNKIISPSHLEEKIQNIDGLYGAVDEQLKPSSNTAFLLLSILTIYLILLGVFLYFDEKRWVFTTLITSFCILFYGLALWGGLQKNKVISASIKKYHNGVTEHSLINVYPCKKEDLSLQFDEATFMDVINSENYSIDLIDKKVHYIRNEDTDEDDIYSLYKEEYSPFEIKTMKMRLEEDCINGEIYNPLADPLYDCFLMMGDTVIPIGDLEGKEKRRISYKLDHNLRNLGDYNYLEQIYNTAELEAYQKNMFEYYFYNLEGVDYKGRLMGFSREKDQIEINNKDENIKNMVCNIFDVEMEYDNKEIFIPCGMIKPIVDYGENEESIEKKEYALEEKELKIHYVIPENIKVQSVQVYTKVDGGEISLEVFNQEENRWDMLTSERMTKDHIQNYISKGILQMRITGNGRIIFPQISVKGIKKVGDDHV